MTSNEPRKNPSNPRVHPPRFGAIGVSTISQRFNAPRQGEGINIKGVG